MLWSSLLTGLVALLLTFHTMPAAAQLSLSSPLAQAPVVLDGYVLFRVRQLEGFSAQERAAFANAVLREELAPQQDVDVEVAQQEETGLTVIRVDDRHLLTVTETDAMFGLPPQQQARVWAEDLREAIAQARYERSPTYLRRAALMSLGILTGAAVLHVGINWLRRRLHRRLSRRSGRQSTPRFESAQLALRVVAVVLKIGLWLIAAYWMTGLFPWLRQWRFQLPNLLITSFISPIFSLGDRGYSVLDVLILIVLVLGLWFFVRTVTLLFRSRILQATGADRALQEAIAVLTQYALTFLGLLVILQLWGLDVSSLTILASVLGVGIGFGLQNIANNFISGLIILLERPIQIGDFINLGSVFGTVERIGARSTEIRTLDQVTIIVPNAHFLEQQVINWSHSDPVSRLRIPVGVAYGSDIEKVRMAILEAAKNHSDVLGYPQPQVWFQGFGDSSLNFELLVWICEPRIQFRLKSDLYYRIEASLRRYGVEIPFPQRDLHVRSPQLEDLIALWISQHSGPEKRLYIPNGDWSSQLLDPPSPPRPESRFDNPKAEPTQNRTGISLEKLVEQMRGSNGIDIRDRRYRLNTYPKCFVGSEAVAWLMRTQKISRADAVQIGQQLARRGIIHHVLDEHDFQDSFLFYRFYSDEQQI